MLHGNTAQAASIRANFEDANSNRVPPFIYISDAAPLLYFFIGHKKKRPDDYQDAFNIKPKMKLLLQVLGNKSCHFKHVN